MSTRAWSLIGSAEKSAGFRAQFHPVRKARIQASQLAQQSRNYSPESEPRSEYRRGNAVRPPRKQNAYPNPRSSYNSSPAPAPPLRRPTHSDADTAEYLHRLFQPHLPTSQPFPEEVATRIVTHASWNKGAEGHNGRLIFLGRRVMNAYLNMFLVTHLGVPSMSMHKPRKSSPKAKANDAFPEPEFDFTFVSERLLDTYILGEHVGSAWELQNVMRWTPALPMSAAPTSSTPPLLALRSSGLYKVRGACVEATIGGIFHQYGGKVAHRIFHTHILPHLAKEGLGLPRQLAEIVQKLQLGFSDPSFPTRRGSGTAQLHEESTQQSSSTVSNQTRASLLSSKSSTKREPIKL